jgi:plastocyanin
MVRRMLLWSSAGLLLVLLLPVVPATAGGGCHAGVTTGSGTVVEMVDACFTPTSLYVRPGDTVTFTNRDPMVHNVTANDWGNLGDLAAGDSFRATFEREGTYPYACTYHPGMTGAIVVGDGRGSGTGEVVALGEPEPSSTVVAQAAVAASSVPANGSRAWPWLAGGLLGFVLGAATTFAVRRSRPRRPDPS